MEASQVGHDVMSSHRSVDVQSVCSLDAKVKVYAGSHQQAFIVWMHMAEGRRKLFCSKTSLSVLPICPQKIHTESSAGSCLAVYNKKTKEKRDKHRKPTHFVSLPPFFFM